MPVPVDTTLEILTKLIDLQRDALLEVVTEQGKVVTDQGERSRNDLESLSKLLVEQNRVRDGKLNDEQRLKSERYGRLRQQLAGPEEVLEAPRVLSFTPEKANEGDTVSILLSREVHVEGVRFAGPANEILTGALTVSKHDAGQQVVLAVPKGAEDGPVTVRTSLGEVVSEGSFDIGVAVPPLPADAVIVVYVR